MGYRLAILGVFLAFQFSCGEPRYAFKDFTHSNSYKNQTEFNKQSSQCWSEKDKHSYKIEGRKFGFKGQNTGYLGCMKLKGWNHIVTQPAR